MATARSGTERDAGGAPSPREVAPPPVFGLRGVVRRYGEVEALSPATLEIVAGERVAVVGPSGAGKSTLLALLNTSLAPSAGAIAVLGRPVAALSPRGLRALRARIGTVYQQLLLVPQATVMQNVVAGRLGRTSLAGALAALVSRREAARVAAVLDALGIADKLYERVDRLSGGEQQRVAVARALYQDPEVIVADEPLASVDPARAAEIAALLARTFAGRTFVISTHRLEPLLPHVTRVLGLRGGAIVFDRQATAVTVEDLSRLYASRRGAAASSPRRLAHRSPEAPAGSVAIGASTAPGEYVLPGALREFVPAHPGVRVTLSVRDSAEVTADLVAGRIDLAFVGARTPHPELHFEDYEEDEIVLVAAPRFAGLPPGPVPPAAIARLPRVQREAGSGTRAVVEETFENLGCPLEPAAVVLEIGSVAGVMNAAASGIGVAFVSRAAARDAVDAGRLRVVPVEGLRIPRKLFVAWRIDRTPGPAARRFVEVARAAARRGGG